MSPTDFTTTVPPIPQRNSESADIGWRGRLFAPLLLMAAFIVPPSSNGVSLIGLPRLCLFHHLTGLPCPGCGLTRSVVAVAHGRIGESLGYHPLGIVLFVLLIGTAIVSLFPKARRFVKDVSFILPIFVLALTTVWVLRLVHLLASPP